jgi:hypothetical protein
LSNILNTGEKQMSIYLKIGKNSAVYRELNISDLFREYLDNTNSVEGTDINQELDSHFKNLVDILVLTYLHGDRCINLRGLDVVLGSGEKSPLPNTEITIALAKRIQDIYKDAPNCNRAYYTAFKNKDGEYIIRFIGLNESESEEVGLRGKIVGINVDVTKEVDTILGRFACSYFTDVVKQELSELITSIIKKEKVLPPTTLQSTIEERLVEAIKNEVIYSITNEDHELEDIEKVSIDITMDAWNQTIIRVVLVGKDVE